jgi:hypothetical protein
LGESSLLFAKAFQNRNKLVLREHDPRQAAILLGQKMSQELTLRSLFENRNKMSNFICRLTGSGTMKSFSSDSIVLLNLLMSKQSRKLTVSDLALILALPEASFAHDGISPQRISES